jgi:non-specific serine/threonine protein kinase
VPPLELPDRKRLPNPDVLAGLASVVLFTQRAQARKPDWALTPDHVRTIAAICLHLDGLPLAIELAAAQIEDLAPEQILAGLENRLKLLRADLRYLPPRQQTLRGAIDWSYHLLTGGERMLLRRLGVFVGGFSLAAVQAACNANHDLPSEPQEGIAALSSKSLLYREVGVDGEPRWGMLESIRAYARERLEASGEAPEIHRLHAGYCVALAEAARAQIRGPEQSRWLERLEQDHDNIRAALAWSTRPSHDAAELGLRLCGALGYFWDMHGHASEGRRWLQAALELPTPSSSAGESPNAKLEREACVALRIKVLVASGGLATVQGDYEAALAYEREALFLCQQTGDKHYMANCLMNLGNTEIHLGDYAQALVLHEQALALRRELEDKPGIALSLVNMGFAAMSLGDYPSAHAFLLECVSLRRELGDKFGIALALGNLGEVAIAEQDYASAQSLLEESLSLRREIGDERGIAFCLVRFANLERARCNYPKARDLYREGLILYRKVGDRRAIASALQWRAELYASMGQVVPAVRLWSAAEMLCQSLGAPIPPSYRSRYEQALARARGELGEETFQQAWAEGRAMSLEQTIEWALQPDASEAPQF